MSYKLIKKTKGERIYSNGTVEIKTVLIRKGWWAFEDLLQVPFIRQAYAKRIEDDFSYGTSALDLSKFFSQIKEVLQSKDLEKYEKVYALILKKEESILMIKDPFKQYLAQCAIYVLRPDEDINELNPEEATAKIKSWSTEESLFFIEWYCNKLQSYYKVFNLINKANAV